MFEHNDEKLIKQALLGKKSAWIKLVKRYEKQIFNYAYRMVNNRDDAFDLMQDIFVAVYRSLSTFKGESQFKSWLFRIAHYRCVEYYRRKKPTQSLDDVPESTAPERHSCPEMSMAIGQQAAGLMSAMQTLPINQRTVIELKFFQHCTFDEIAVQLGVSPNTVKSRLYNALDKLKGELGVNYV